MLFWLRDTDSRELGLFRFKRLIPQIFFNNSQDLVLSLVLGLVSSFLCKSSLHLLSPLSSLLLPFSSILKLIQDGFECNVAYCSPYFLKQILQSLTPPIDGGDEPYDKGLRKSAFIYGGLAFVAQIARAEVGTSPLLSSFLLFSAGGKLIELGGGEDRFATIVA